MTVPLIDLVARDLATPVREAVHAFAEALAAEQDTAAVLFYGSILRTGDLDGVLDFYILTDGPHRTGLRGWRERKLWPEVDFRECTHSETVLRAKIAVLPLTTFAEAAEAAADSTISVRKLETLLAEETAAAGTPQDEAPAALSSSAGVLRLTAVVTQTTAARLELESITDLNGRCESLTAVAPPALTAAADPDAATALRARLDRLAGCRPETWLADTEDPTAAVVADEAQVALLTGTDPEIDANTLVPLEDDGRVLPEGRLTAVGSAATLDDDAERRIAEVMSALDGDGLRELERLTTGADPLPVAEAAQYWLVDHGLEDAPEDWFVPRGSWF